MRSGTEHGTLLGTMRSREDIEPITALKTRPAMLVERARSSRRPVVITQNGKASAVLLDIQTYEELKDATTMLKIVEQSEARVREGHVVSQEEAFARARARLRQR